MTDTQITSRAEPVEDRVIHNVRRAFAGALGVAGIGLVGFIIGVLVDPTRTLFAYLAAFAWAFSIAFGALFMVMIGHVTNARWFVVVRRLGESIADTLSAFAVLFIPIAVGVATLYPWAPPFDGLARHVVENIERKDAWLNVPFWLARAVLYFALLTFFAWRLRQWSLAQDGEGRAPGGHRPQLFSGLGLFILGFVVTLAAWDWLMSLKPDWVSTVFGAYWWTGGFLAGLCAMTVLARWLERGGALSGIVAAGHYYALGRLMLTFTVFWAYMAFSQGFMIWIADLPHEVTWYIARTSGSWWFVFWTLILGHFAIPFFLLLSRRLKQDGGRLTAVAVWLLAMHYVDMFWLVLPALSGASPGLYWQDIAGLALVGGGAAAFAIRRSSGHAVLPLRDPRLEASIQYRRAS